MGKKEDRERYPMLFGSPHQDELRREIQKQSRSGSGEKLSGGLCLLIVLAMVAAIGAVTAAAGSAAPADNRILVRQYPACPTEDSQACVWRANVHGNGQGRSFVAGVSEGRRVFYSHRLARKLAARHGTWRRVPDRLVGRRVDFVKGGSFVVGRRAVVSYGDTTYIITRGAKVGTS